MNRAKELAIQAHYLKPQVTINKFDSKFINISWKYSFFQCKDSQWEVRALILFEELKTKADKDLSDNEKLQNLESLADLYSEFYFKNGDKFDRCLVAAVGKYESCIELGRVFDLIIQTFISIS